MSRFKERRGRKYTEPVTVKVDLEIVALMDFVAMNGGDVPEMHRDALREFFKNAKQEIILKREHLEAQGSVA